MDTNVVILSLQLLLPIFDDFAEKADLSLQRPLTEQRVTKARIGNSYNSGTMVTFDHRYQFNWYCSSNCWGSVDGYVDKEFASNYIWNDNPGDEEKIEAWTKLKSQIDANGALQIAADVLRRLGYNELEAELTPPEVQQLAFGKDEKGNAKLLPFFSINWYPKHPPKGVKSHAFHIEVSGLTKKVTKFNKLWVDNSDMDLRSLIKNLPEPLQALTNRPTSVKSPR